MTTRLITIALIVTAITAGVTSTSCRRGEEEPVPAEPSAVSDLPPSIPLPVDNPVVGVALTSAPAGLIVTYNDGNWIELTESRQPSVRYTFAVNSDQLSRAEAPSIEEFEQDILGYDDGAITGNGTMETALGPANWTSGSYSEDGEAIEKIYVSASHPKRTTPLIVTSVGPPEAVSVNERLERIKDLLTHVS